MAEAIEVKGSFVDLQDLFTQEDAYDDLYSDIYLAWKREIFDRLHYYPSVEQWKVHECLKRIIALGGGERAGKSRVLGSELAIEGIASPVDMRKKRIAIAAYSYDETRQECEYVMEWLSRLGILSRNKSTPEKGAWRWSTTEGTEYETVSLKDGGNELTGRGKSYHLVGICEAGRIPHDVFKAARGRVSETRGRVIMAGTLWDEFGWYSVLFQNLLGINPYGGAAFSMPSWSNLAVYPGGRNDPEIKALEAVTEHREFMRRYGAVILPGPARIYPAFDEDIHVREWVSFDPRVSVQLTFDAGYHPSKYATLAIQTTRIKSGRVALHVIDGTWENFVTHQDVIADLEQRAWWPAVEYVYGGHETAAHPGAKSAQEVWVELARKPFRLCYRITPKHNGFMRIQNFLQDPETKEPRLFINPRCEGLIHEFKRYERKTDRDHNPISDDPPDDAEDDALDALTNFSTTRYGLVDVVNRPHVRKTRRRRPARG